MSLRDDMARRGPFLDAGAKVPIGRTAPGAAPRVNAGSAAPASEVPGARASHAAGAEGRGGPSRDYDRIRLDLHREVLSRLDLGRAGVRPDEAAFAVAVERFVDDALSTRSYALTREEKARLSRDVVEEALGLGPLGPLLADPSVDDVLVNGPADVWVERFGRLERTEVRFEDDRHLLAIIDRIVSRVGRHVDEASPMVDARLPDGSRVNAIIPPLSLVGPTLSIRRFGRERLRPEDLLRLDALSPAMLVLLENAVAGRLNVLVSGGTGSGKTTLLNALSGYIPEGERVITIEDAAELRLRQRHVVPLETRPPNVEGKGRVSARDLVVNALRMRPDRIIVGEVRGAEAFDMLQAMNTGHDGSLTTVHANSPRDALARIENMVLMAGTDLPSRAIRDQIAAALDLVVHVARMEDGTRKVSSVVEVAGTESGVIATQEIFRYERRGLREGRVQGDHRPTGVIPRCLEDLEARGRRIDRAVFRATASTKAGMPVDGRA